MLRIVRSDEMSWSLQHDLVLDQQQEIQKKLSYNQELRVSNTALIQKLSTLQALLNMQGISGPAAVHQKDRLKLNDTHLSSTEYSTATIQQLMRTNHELQDRIAQLQAENSSLESAVAAQRDIGTIHHHIEMLETKKLQLERQERHREAQLASLRENHIRLRDASEPAGQVLAQLRRESADLSFEKKKLEKELQLALQKAAAAEREVRACGPPVLVYSPRLRCVTALPLRLTLPLEAYTRVIIRAEQNPTILKGGYRRDPGPRRSR